MIELSPATVVAVLGELDDHTVLAVARHFDDAEFSAVVAALPDDRLADLVGAVRRDRRWDDALELVRRLEPEQARRLAGLFAADAWGRFRGRLGSRVQSGSGVQSG